MEKFPRRKPLKTRRNLEKRHNVNRTDFVSRRGNGAHDSTVLLIVCIKKTYRAKSGAVRPDEQLVAGMGRLNETSVALSEWRVSLTLPFPDRIIPSPPEVVRPGLGLSARKG
jgi:hypothetical protein